MPIVPPVNAPATPAPTVPHLVPAAQRVTPVEPAKRVTASKQSGRAERHDEDRRRHPDEPEEASGERGGLCDFEA